MDQRLGLSGTPRMFTRFFLLSSRNSARGVPLGYVLSTRGRILFGVAAKLWPSLHATRALTAISSRRWAKICRSITIVNSWRCRELTVHIRSAPGQCPQRSLSLWYKFDYLPRPELLVPFTWQADEFARFAKGFFGYLCHQCTTSSNCLLFNKNSFAEWRYIQQCK